MIKDLKCWNAAHPAVRYSAPFIVFLLMTQLQSAASGADLFWLYGLKIGITSIVIIFCFSDYTSELQGKADPAAVICGIAALAIWIAFGAAISPDFTVSFDPLLLNPGIERSLGVAVRIIGAALIVPFVEEVFWRGFLMRYLIADKFQSVTVGAYTAKSFFLTLLCFMLVHRPFEWPGAIAVGLIYGGYVVKTGNLRGVIVAHGVTNLGLAIFVLMTGQYWWW